MVCQTSAFLIRMHSCNIEHISLNHRKVLLRHYINIGIFNFQQIYCPSISYLCFLKFIGFVGQLFSEIF